MRAPGANPTPPGPAARILVALTLLFYLACGLAAFVGEARLAKVTGYYKQRHRADARIADRRDASAMTSREMIAHLEAAASLMPNAAAHYEFAKVLHRLALTSEGDGGITPARAAERALAEYALSYTQNACNPKAHFWRAMLLDSLGERETLMEKELEAALALEPADPSTNYRLGLHLLGTGRRGQAAPLLNTALQRSIGLLDPIADALLPLPGGYEQLAALMPATELALDRFQTLLFERGLFQESYAQWARILSLHGRDAPDPGPGVGRVHNGGFESPLGAHFHGWETVPAPGVTVDRDSNAPRSGTHCLRIGFEKAHGNYFNFSQRLALQRETGYVVSAWMKTEGLPTDGPVGLEVIHPKGHRRFCAAASAEETKDSGWSRVTVRFETPSDTPYLVLRLRRFGGPEIITGALWTDDVEISESRIHP